MAPGAAELSILNSLAFSNIEDVHNLFRHPAILLPFTELYANCDVTDIENIPPYLAVQYCLSVNRPGFGLKFFPGRGTLVDIDKSDWAAADHFADFVYKVSVGVFLGIVSWPCLSFEDDLDIRGPDCYQIALALSAVYRRKSVQRELQRRTGQGSFTLEVQHASPEDEEDVVYPDFNGRADWRLFMAALTLLEARLV